MVDAILNITKNIHVLDFHINLPSFLFSSMFEISMSSKIGPFYMSIDYCSQNILAKKLGKRYKMGISNDD